MMLRTLRVTSTPQLLCLLAPWGWELTQCQAVCRHAPGVGHRALRHQAPWNSAGLACIACSELLGAYGFGGEPAAHKANCQQQAADACVGEQGCATAAVQEGAVCPAAGAPAAAQSGLTACCLGTEPPLLCEVTAASKSNVCHTCSCLLLLWCHAWASYLLHRTSKGVCVVKCLQQSQEHKSSM